MNVFVYNARNFRINHKKRTLKSHKDAFFRKSIVHALFLNTLKNRFDKKQQIALKYIRKFMFSCQKNKSTNRVIIRYN